MVFENLLDPVLRPLLYLDPLWGVIIISLLISLIITFIYKLTTNQDLMKRLKTEMKELQKEMKELREHPEEMMKVQKQAMQTNMKYMSQSMKSTLYTFLPIILIFSWMNAHFAYDPILPGDQFSVTLLFEKGSTGSVSVTAPDGINVVGDFVVDIVNDVALFNFRGDLGSYLQETDNSLVFDYNSRLFYKDVIISDGFEYAAKDERVKNNNLKMISLSYNKKTILPVLNWGWLGTYIVFSIVFSMLLRKMLKVY